jgi:hypothetical protein
MAGNQDLKAHERTYFSMINLMKYGTIVIAIVVAIVLWLIS